MTRFGPAQHEALARIADFDHVFMVIGDGYVTEVDSADEHRLYAPEAFDVDPNTTELDGWQLPLSGLTGQHGYSGPWLHDSELIIGAVAERVLSMPGYWVAIYATFSAQDDFDEDHIEGWTLAYRPFNEE